MSDLGAPPQIQYIPTSLHQLHRTLIIPSTVCILTQKTGQGLLFSLHTAAMVLDDYLTTYCWPHIIPLYVYIVCDNVHQINTDYMPHMLVTVFAACNILA